MSKSRFILAAAAICAIPVALPATSRAQSGESYGGQGLGSALANSPMMHQGLTKRASPTSPRADKESTIKIVKDMKLARLPRFEGQKNFVS
jgi:hypothetical protein